MATSHRSGPLPSEPSSAEVGIQSISLILRGRRGSPLVVHAFSDTAKQSIRDKQAKKPTRAKPERDTAGEFLSARYLDDAGRECVPVIAIKKSLIAAATAFADLTKVALRQALFVEAESDPGSALVPIELHDGSPAIGVMREDAVTIGVNTRGLTYRPMYEQWQVRVRVEFNPRLISREQLLALVDQAGWGIGICEGRPEKSSALSWGRFERVR